MTSDQLRAYLDAHGVDGPPTVPGWYVVDISGITLGMAWVVRCDAGGKMSWGGEATVIYPSRITRHAPLPDFAAMARELEELRARESAASVLADGLRLKIRDAKWRGGAGKPGEQNPCPWCGVVDMGHADRHPPTCAWRLAFAEWVTP